MIRLSKQFPTEFQVPCSLISHFIRGYFDGDGCISYSLMYRKNKTGSKPYYSIGFHISSSLAFCESLLDFCCKNLNISRTKILKNSSIYRFCSSSIKTARLLYYFMYKEATVFLERKKQKFDEVLLLCQ